MDRHKSIEFLFAMVHEVKRSLARPVILVTMKDYLASVVGTLTELRRLAARGGAGSIMAELVGYFHVAWLQAVEDVEDFKQCVRTMPRDYLSHAIDFTVDCAETRNHEFNNFIQNLAHTMTDYENQLMLDDLDILDEMHEQLVSTLRMKQKDLICIRDPLEYHLSVLDEAEELLTWLDTLNDNLAVCFCKIYGSMFPDLIKSLMNILQQIIDDLNTMPNKYYLSAKKVALKRKGAGFLNRNFNTVEINTIVDKIKDVEHRIDRLRNDSYSTFTSLQTEALYLEQRILSLENLKKTLYTSLKEEETSHRPLVQIFDHLLPGYERCRLISNLLQLWSTVTGGKSKCTAHNLSKRIRIKKLDACDWRVFSVDSYGRRIFKGTDGTLYQIDGRNELVPVADDEHHVYFYDDCGRYYLDDNKQRIYKAHADSSEYYLGIEGLLKKIRDNQTRSVYWYDKLGRYYLNKDEKKVYTCGDELFEDDGIGNLVRIRKKHEMLKFTMKEEEEGVMSEAGRYLQQAVGAALRTCIAALVLRQPADPVGWLAGSLEHYRRTQQGAVSRQRDEQFLHRARNHAHSNSE